jgi:carbon storage regulator CsrA
MLVLARKNRESVVISSAEDMQELARVTVLEVRGGTVKLGFVADDDVGVHREEVWERVRAECKPANPTPVAERPKYRVPYLD